MHNLKNIPVIPNPIPSWGHLSTGFPLINTGSLLAFLCSWKCVWIKHWSLPKPKGFSNFFEFFKLEAFPKLDGYSGFILALSHTVEYQGPYFCFLTFLFLCGKPVCHLLCYTPIPAFLCRTSSSTEIETDCKYCSAHCLSHLIINLRVLSMQKYKEPPLFLLRTVFYTIKYVPQFIGSNPYWRTVKTFLTFCLHSFIFLYLIHENLTICENNFLK